MKQQKVHIKFDEHPNVGYVVPEADRFTYTCMASPSQISRWKRVMKAYDKVQKEIWDKTYILCGVKKNVNNFSRPASQARRTGRRGQT